MAKENIVQLEEKLKLASASLSEVTEKKMFGCHALWADGNVFALVWKHGRIGVKLPIEESYNLLMSLPGAEPWKAGPMKMSHWVLVPESFHTKSGELKKWTAKAHHECLKLEKKSKKVTTKKKSVSGTVKKKVR